jgi:hypothetical protein
MGSWAEERELFSQNFNQFTITGTSYTGNYESWALNNCSPVSNNVYYALKIAKNGFAETPMLGVNGTVKLSFKYARGTANYTNLSISVDGDGTILNNQTLKPKERDIFEEATFTISDVSINTRIKFTVDTESNPSAIDDVVVAAVDDIPTINLYQNNSNGTTLSDNMNKFVDVSTDRTLFPGVCHTMCLPFDMNRAKMIAAVGDDQNPLMYTYTGLVENNSMSFTEIGDNGIVPAGTPFLLKVNKGFENLKFYAVKITATTPTDVTYGDVTFKGTFNPTDLQTDGTELFLGTDNYLYIPDKLASEARTLGGMRAYIHRSNTARLGISFNDEAAAIHETTVPAVDSPLYNLQGQRIVQPRSKSLYIKNGKKMIQQ